MRLIDWARDLWRRNVRIESVPVTNGLADIPDSDWEPVASFGAPVMRCRHCGDLVRLVCLTEHQATVHGRLVVAILRLYDNGDGEVDVAKGMTLLPTHARIIKDFLERQTNEMLRDAVDEVARLGARGQAQLLALLDTRGQVN
jgi:hypothetical protein